MKHLSILVAACVLAFASNASALTLNVKQNTKLDSKGKTNDTKKQTRSLDIVMTSLDSGTVEVQVRWWFFAKDMKSGKETVFKRGTQKTSLETNVATTVQSDTITTSYTEEHTELEKSKGKGKGKNEKAKKIPASGERITGYAVQVIAGKGVIADYYSAPSYKELIQERGR